MTPPRRRQPAGSLSLALRSPRARSCALGAWTCLDLAAPARSRRLHASVVATYTASADGDGGTCAPGPSGNLGCGPSTAEFQRYAGDSSAALSESKRTTLGGRVQLISMCLHFLSEDPSPQTAWRRLPARPAYSHPRVLPTRDGQNPICPTLVGFCPRDPRDAEDWIAKWQCRPCPPATRPLNTPPRLHCRCQTGRAAPRRPAWWQRPECPPG